MVSMLKVQMAEMSSKVSYLEGCECTRQVCQFNGIEYQDKQSWQVDPCKQCVCQSGIVICQIYQDRPECVQPCISNPCPANTRCVGYPGYQNYTCLCADGQEGPNCEESNINVCTKPAEYGTCSKSEQKYYYNQYTQRCEEFVYSGCGGNTNNFESKRDCEEQCLIGACCHRTYIRTNPGLTFLAFTVLEPGFKCEIHSIHACKDLAEITGTTDKRQEVVSFHPGQGCKNGVCGLPSGCIFGSQIYKPGDTFRTNCQECTCQSNGNVQCRCDTVTMRKEIRDMTRSEIERFQSAVQKLQSSKHGNLWLELRNLYIRHVMHANGPMYLPWHRVFLRRVEQQLQEIDCDVTLPYFDFTMDVGNMSNALIWQANYFGGDGQGRCVPDLPFQDANQPWQPCLQRDLNPTVQLPSMVDFYVALSSNDFNEMSRCLQTYVSYFHEFVGGDMSSSGSTYDPLFFAVHSYIDMLYWRWQNKNGNTDNFPDFMKSIPMVPFNIRPEDTFNSEQHLCVSYTLPSFGDPCNDTAFVLDDEGFDPQGFNMQGFNRQGYDRFGYDFKGYDVRGQLDNRDVFSFDGYDEYGYNRVGYDRLGYNRHGYSQDGYNRDGFDIQGYDRAGFDRYGYNRQGYDRRGFDRSGYDIHQYLDTHGFYSVNGYNYYCLDRQGLNPAGFDRYGFNMEFHDEEYCSYSFNGPHITKTAYRVQEILYKQNKNFLMTIPRTCVELQPLPVSWYEQVWILNPKGVPVSVVREVTQYPDQSASQRFCFEVEKILDYCVCEETLVECPENPCENADCPAFPGATCFIDFCHECKAKWVSNDKEVDCTMPPDPCASNPCHNGGTCIAESIWPNEPDLFRCHCVPPYTGKLCEKEQFDLCMLPLDSGTRNCGRERVLWYFNMAAMECEQFVYSGCDGNANRFTSYRECQRSCITGACCWRTPSNPDDAIGYDKNGYDKYGYNIDGLNELGLDEATAQALNGDLVNFSDFDESGFDSNGCDRQGYDRLGYHCLTGFNLTGYNRIGEYDGITTYDRFGFDQDGYNRAGFDCNGINNEGRDYLGLNVGYVYECRVMSMMDCQAMEETAGNSREVLKFSLGKSCEDVQCGDICGCDFNGQTYRIGESFEYGCQQCSCTMSGSVQCACDGITQRREIRDLTADEMKRYQNAIKSLHLHTGNPSIWDYFVNLHADSIPQAYGTESFLPWHRYFLRAVEMELQKIDCGIFIPYFDWAIDAGDMDSSVAWQANYFGGDGEPDTDCVLHHPFKEHWPQTWGPCLRRNFNHNIQLPDAVNFQFIINEPSYEQFRVQLEAASGLFQLWVGGHMATPYSPYDPLFLSHFAFMDMIWDIWQQRNPDGVSRYPVPFRHIPMSPWQATPDEVLENQDQVCVVYIFPTEGVICNTTGKSVPSDQGRYVHHGYDSEGYDRDGYDVAGLDRYGMPDTRGIYNVDGYNKDGYRRNGFDDSGYDIYGFNTDHLNRDGFDVHGYDISGYDRYGFDKDGVTPFGFTRDGSYLPGFEENEHFDSSGYNRTD
ncbi:uncharacterized protein [Ptychodera flava]|uniref:uncharacterized protein n=1 Tax=Ptychodera flava TaxID=63121 RepID=UPI003969C469